MTQWYYVDPQQQRQGPVDRDALVRLFHTRNLTVASLVWREGMGQWRSLGEAAAELGLPPLAPPTPPAPPPAPVEDSMEAEEERPLTGRAVFTAREPTYARHAAPHASQAEAVAAAAQAQAQASASANPYADRNDASPYAAPSAPVYADSGVIADGHVVYAGFWKRVAASIIDSFALGIPVSVVTAIVGALFGGGFGGFDDPFKPGETLGSYVLMALVFAWFHSSAGLMATPGKLAVGIKVVRTDGEKISFLRGFGRYWAYMLSSLLLCIGLIMAAFTERKQGLHDLICDTLVVDKWAFTRQPERQREELGTVTVVVLALGGVLLAIALIAIVFAIIGLASMAR
ncbi:RDD family protein [Pseudoxanthomonas putridarboris]|uniref:RDD family protein n=1 Tax=Pseudoxanthomonas putridarboris TaxID=752605 RepID=A0ABU9IWT5_9GAMM